MEQQSTTGSTQGNGRKEEETEEGRSERREQERKPGEGILKAWKLQNARQAGSGACHVCVISTLWQSHRTWGTDRNAGRYTCTKTEKHASEHGQRDRRNGQEKKHRAKQPLTGCWALQLLTAFFWYILLGQHLILCTWDASFCCSSALITYYDASDVHLCMHLFIPKRCVILEVT